MLRVFEKMERGVPSEKRVFTLSMVPFAGTGIAAWLGGHKTAGYLFFAAMGVFVLGFLYQSYRQRRALKGGPPDPSEHWGTNVDLEATTFKYSKAELMALHCGAVLSLLVGPAIYILASPRSESANFAGLCAVEVVVALAFCVGYRFYMAYSVTIAGDAITVKSLFRKREFRFSMLGKIALLESGGRGVRYVLALYDKDGRKACLISDGVEDFEKMVVLAKEAAFAAGTPYRYRDMWGCWTT